jgi:hypothetical protein
LNARKLGVVGATCQDSRVPAFAHHRRTSVGEARGLLETRRSATVFDMTLKARVKAGRLVDEEGRPVLHQALRDSDKDVKVGRLVDAEHNFA